MENRVVTDDGRVIETNNSEIPVSTAPGKRIGKKNSINADFNPDEDFDARAKANSDKVK